MNVLKRVAQRGTRAIRRRSRPPFTLVFLHIPKTGGMSLREVLLRRARGRPTFWIVDPVKDTAWLRSIPAEQRERYVLVEGHMYFGVHQWLPRPCVYMTMLRDPVERVLSFYSHIRERPDHHLHEAARGLPIGECIRRGLTVELDNFMVRSLTSLRRVEVPFGGVTREMFDEARAHLETVSFLGLTERFDESLARFGRALGWPRHAAPRMNTSARRVLREQLSSDDLRLVDDANAWDAALYRFAAELFEARGNL